MVNRCRHGNLSGRPRTRHRGPTVCTLRGGIELTEIWTHWNDGHTFTYEGQGVPLLRLARNTWTVTPEGTRTLLTSNAEVTVKGGRLGRLLEPLIAWQAKRIGNRTLNVLRPSSRLAAL